MKPTRLKSSIALVLLLLSSSLVYAYSYSAAGKEPVIDGREAIMAALAKEDFAAVNQAFAQLTQELEYLQQEHGVDLLTSFGAAVKARDSKAINREMDRLLYQEIVRRLDSAQRHINDYQLAKVMVVKSKLFLDLLMTSLSQPQRQTAEQAISSLLESIGNPGVFGVGQKAPNAVLFEENRRALFDVLSDHR